MVDTGAAASCISHREFNKLPKSSIIDKLAAPKLKLRAAGGNELSVTGMYRLSFTIRWKRLYLLKAYGHCLGKYQQRIKLHRRHLDAFENTHGATPGIGKGFYQITPFWAQNKPSKMPFRTQ